MLMESSRSQPSAGLSRRAALGTVGRVLGLGLLSSAALAGCGEKEAAQQEQEAGVPPAAEAQKHRCQH